MMGLKLDAARAFVFDLDDTLINWRAAERGAFEHTVMTHLEPEGVGLARADAHYQRVLYENFAAFRSTGRWWYARDRLHRLLQLLGLDDRLETEPLESTFRAAVDRRLDFLNGAEELLYTVRAAGYKVALLTNGPAPFQREKFSRLGIDHHFDYVGISGETGHWKPGPAAFQDVLDNLKLPAAAAAMVGDSVHFDIAPAHALGLQTVWVDAHGGGADPAQGNLHLDGRALADAVVPDPAALARLIRAA